MDKFSLCKEIGNFFGDYFEQNGKLCINNGLSVFQYDSPDALLVDWLDTLIMHQHDTFGVGSWEKEITFIYSSVIGKFPAGVQPVDNKEGRNWKCSVDVADGSRHGKNLHLGTYNSIVDAIYARKEFLDRTVSLDTKHTDSLIEVIQIAQDIQNKGTLKRLDEKTAAKETAIRLKYDLSTPEGIIKAQETAQERAQDNSNQSIYEAGWLNGYVRGLEVAKEQVAVRSSAPEKKTALDVRIQAASTRAAESIPEGNVVARESHLEH